MNSWLSNVEIIRKKKWNKTKYSGPAFQTLVSEPDSDSTVTITMGLPLGRPVASARHCGSDLDFLGEHALSCNKGVGRGARHHEVNTRIRSPKPDARQYWNPSAYKAVWESRVKDPRYDKQQHRTLQRLPTSSRWAGDAACILDAHSHMATSSHDPTPVTASRVPL